MATDRDGRLHGMLIAFEGLDQSGKETQARALGRHLAEAGHRVELLAFPDYKTAIAEEIALALRGQRQYAADVLQLLFIANRYEYRAQIEQWLREGVIVLTDRYIASSVAYGEAQGLDAAWLCETQRFLPRPALTVLLDIAPATAERRKTKGRDRFERDLGLLERVRASYLRQAGQAGWVRVDGEGSTQDVATSILALVRERLGLS